MVSWEDAGKQVIAPFESLEHVPMPAYVFRVVADEFVLEDINALGRTLNPSLSVLVGKPMGGLYRDQPQVLECAHRAVAAGAAVTSEFTMRRHDRTEATQPLRLTFVPSPPSHLLIFVQDVATPETAATALRESDARYRSVVASLPDGLVLRGADGRVLACNDVAIRLLGATSQGDLIGAERVLAPGLRVTTESGEPVDEEDFPGRRALSTGLPQEARLFALVDDTRTRWIRVAAEPVLSVTGAVTGSVTTYTDITDRVTAQRAQREATERLELALAAARLGIWEYDPGADVGWWSSNLDSIFGLRDHPPTLAAFLEFVHPEDRAQFIASAGAITSAADGNSFEYEFRIIGSDGTIRWARTRGRMSQDSGRTRLVGTVMDITEHHHLEEELRRAHRLESIGRLAGGIAHDFNNLLAAMMGSLELLERQCPPAAMEDLVTVQHAATRARDLTKQLLAFARKQPIEFKDLDLAEMVRKVERLLRRLVGPTIEMVIEGTGPVWVRADPASLEQVLVNLVVNAGEAMPDGGRLHIVVGQSRAAGAGNADLTDYATLQVSDSGVGMDAETRGRVFDPFFTTKTHGTGLGLASSYGIARQHGGDIVVESEPGQGTRFRVLLPRLPDRTEASVRPSTANATVPRKGCVLVVDDEPMVRSTTARLLQSLGYEVLSAGSAEEAAERSREHPGTIDVLVCDIAMPGRSGPSVAAELMRARPGLKVMFASGYADSEDASELRDATFLQKPYSRAQLAEKLAALEATPRRT